MQQIASLLLFSCPCDSLTRVLFPRQWLPTFTYPNPLFCVESLPVVVPVHISRDSDAVTFMVCLIASGFGIKIIKIIPTACSMFKTYAFVGQTNASLLVSLMKIICLD